ncbi:MAG: ABC transporter ATP-binding protein [Spirochaetia bacterium]
MTDTIRMDAVKKVFSSRKDSVHAVGPLSLEVRRGEFVSLLGPSGCGKSTLLMMIAGLIEPSEGAITIEDKEVHEPQTDIGIVFQSPVLVDWRDVLGNVLLQIEMRKLDRKVYEAKAIQLLTSVGLKDFLHKRPYELSGGMQQRTAFCRALIHDPPLILMDEPLGALDAMTREQLRRDLEQLWLQTRKTLVFVTHDIAEAVQLSDRIVLITPRPGMVDRTIEIDLPRPRDFSVLKSEQFVRYEAEIKEVFMGYGVV